MASVRVRQRLFEKWAEADLLLQFAADEDAFSRRQIDRDRYAYLMNMARTGATDKEVMAWEQKTTPTRRVARMVGV